MSTRWLPRIYPHGPSTYSARIARRSFNFRHFTSESLRKSNTAHRRTYWGDLEGLLPQPHHQWAVQLAVSGRRGPEDELNY